MRYTRGDIRPHSASAVKASATSCLITTEKDAQRLRDCKNVPQSIRERLFYIPVEAAFLTPEEQEAFTRVLNPKMWAIFYGYPLPFCAEDYSNTLPRPLTSTIRSERK